MRVLDARDDVRGVWTAGFGHGGTFAVCEAAEDPLVRGVATIVAPSTLLDWARDPGHLMEHARNMGMIHSPDFPRDRSAWVREVARMDAVEAVSHFDDRPLFVLHGVDDAEVPVAEARALVARGWRERRTATRAWRGPSSASRSARSRPCSDGSNVR